MTLIEGVGDEVTNFFIAVSAILIGWIAWCSTNIRDQPLVRTVLILQHRNRSRNNNSSADSNQQSVNSEQINQQAATAENDNTLNNATTSNNDEENTVCTENLVTGSPAEDELDSNRAESNASSSSNDKAGSEEILIQAMDSQNNGEQSTSAEGVKEKPPEEASGERSEANLNSGETKISIKLKFINDDQRLVTASLGELLGDFKKRHFQPELENQKLVRLVFKGKVLQPDDMTLENCGFYNNCVVHCLIHNSNSSTPTSTNSSHFYFNSSSFHSRRTNTSGNGVAQNDWDLSRLLVSVLTLILGVAWYFRYHYAQLFTVTTTMGLFALTAVFTVSLFGHFFPDQDLRNVD